MTTPTHEQLLDAFTRVRGDDWPADLRALQLAVARMTLVEAAAKALARGQRVLARQAPLDTAPPLPSRPSSTRALGHTERLRRHGDAVDLKRLAAGDRDD